MLHIMPKSSLKDMQVGVRIIYKSGIYIYLLFFILYYYLSVNVFLETVSADCQRSVSVGHVYIVCS